MPEAQPGSFSLRAAWNELRRPFQRGAKPAWPIIMVFVLINGLVLTNALLHDPRQGYDAADHLNYIKTLALKHTLPSCAETGQCYVPPLPYLLPAIALSTGRLTLWQAAKLAQLIDVLLSLGLTYYLLKIGDILEPPHPTFKLSTLALVGLVPLYYKTFALIRGETYLAFLFVLAFYFVLSIFLLGRARILNILMLGLVVGLGVLARQWGLLLLPAILLFGCYVSLRDHRKFKAALQTMIACFMLPLLVAGWYYLSMFARYGTLLAAGWDRNAAAPTRASLPLSFFVGLGSGQLFGEPVRPNFTNQLPAIFYSDTWGDYGAYFLIYGRDKTSGTYVTGQYLEKIVHSGSPLPANLDTNWHTFSPYLGRVNLLSLLPSGVLFAGLILAAVRAVGSSRGTGRDGLELDSVFALLVVTCSLGGYLWYLVHYQLNGQAGDLVKAVHMIQVFPFLALLGGRALEQVRSWRPAFWSILMVALGLVWLYDLPAMLTHYVLLP